MNGDNNNNNNNNINNNNKQKKRTRPSHGVRNNSCELRARRLHNPRRDSSALCVCAGM